VSEMEWSTVKVVLDNMIRGLISTKSRALKKRVADFLRNLADDLDTELSTEPNKEPDHDAT